jgi:hypothetical protein
VVVGLDGCPELVAMPSAISGCELWQQDMLAIGGAQRADAAGLAVAADHCRRRKPQLALAPEQNARGGGQGRVRARQTRSRPDNPAQNFFDGA